MADMCSILLKAIVSTVIEHLVDKIILDISIVVQKT